MQPTETSIKDAVKAFILAEFLPGESPDALDESTQLITSGVLDSIATVKLVSFLEEQYGVALEAHELNAEYLNTLDDIARLVTSRAASK
jgi:acyl carrier protein